MNRTNISIQDNIGNKREQQLKKKMVNYDDSSVESSLLPSAMVSVSDSASVSIPLKRVPSYQNLDDSDDESSIEESSLTIAIDSSLAIINRSDDAHDYDDDPVVFVDPSDLDFVLDLTDADADGAKPCNMKSSLSIGSFSSIKDLLSMNSLKERYHETSSCEEESSLSSQESEDDYVRKRPYSRPTSSSIEVESEDESFGSTGRAIECSLWQSDSTPKIHGSSRVVKSNRARKSHFPSPTTAKIANGAYDSDDESLGSLGRAIEGTLRSLDSTQKMHGSTRKVKSTQSRRRKPQNTSSRYDNDEVSVDSHKIDKIFGKCDSRFHMDNSQRVVKSKRHQVHKKKPGENMFLSQQKDGKITFWNLLSGSNRPVKTRHQQTSSLKHDDLMTRFLTSNKASYDDEDPVVKKNDSFGKI